METKYTKGKWIKRNGDSDCKFDILGEFGTNKTIAIIPNKCFVGDEEAEANAKLIASAPELLETLKKLKSDAEVYLKIFTTNEILIDGAKLMMCNNLLGAIAELANEAIVKATE